MDNEWRTTWLQMSRPHLKIIVRDKTHARKRLLSSPCAADAWSQEIVQKTLRRKKSSIQMLQFSTSCQHCTLAKDWDKETPAALDATRHGLMCFSAANAEPNVAKNVPWKTQVVMSPFARVAGTRARGMRTICHQ